MWSKTFAMMVRVQGDVTVEQMNDALRKVRVRHVALISAMPYPPGQKQPVGEVFFPLAVRTDCRDTDWIEVAQHELSEPFPEPEEPPFARFTLLKRVAGFDLVAGFHHHVCDGMSGMFVMRDILQALGQPDAPVIPLMAPPRDEDMKVPDEILTLPRFQRKLTRKFEKIQAQLLHEKQRKAALPQNQAKPLINDSPLARQFVLLPALLSASQTAALVARCKQEQVSVHAAVCVAWLRAFLAESKSKRTRRMASSPVNIRQRVSPPIPDTSGGFLVIVETSVDCAPEKNFWDVAREFKRKFVRDTSDEALFLRSALFEQVFSQVPQEDIEILIQILFFGQVKYDYSMTNLGRLPIPERNGNFQVEAFYGPLVNSSSHERTVGISTLAGKMSVSFIFRQSMMAPARGKALMDRALNLLFEAVK